MEFQSCRFDTNFQYGNANYRKARSDKEKRQTTSYSATRNLIGCSCLLIKFMICSVVLFAKKKKILWKYNYTIERSPI